MHRAGRPGPVIAERPCRLDDKARAVAIEGERALLAPLLASDHGRVAFGRRIAGRHHDGGTSAILLECVRSENVRDEAAIGELGDTACGITGDAAAEVLVVDVAAAGVGSEPLAGCERIAAGTMQR